MSNASNKIARMDQLFGLLACLDLANYFREKNFWDLRRVAGLWFTGWRRSTEALGIETQHNREDRLAIAKNTLGTANACFEGFHGCDCDNFFI